MNYTVMAYTRRENRELESAMHLAAVLENGSLQPLQNGTGILLAKAEFNEGPLCGTTKILRKPWVFRLKDGDVYKRQVYSPARGFLRSPPFLPPVSPVLRGGGGI